MSPARRAALGFSVRTGRAIVVALGGPVAAPAVLAKTRIDVAFTFDEGAVYHVAQELPLAQARALVREAEQRFVELARAALAGFVAELDVAVVAAGMVAPEPKPPPPLETILKVHPLVHAAEGELYRRVFAAASATALSVQPVRVPADVLARRASAALAIKPSALSAKLAAIGKAAGKPWAADQKQAALVAWLALASAGS